MSMATENLVPDGNLAPNPNPNPNPAPPAVNGVGNGNGNPNPAVKVYFFKEDRADWINPNDNNGKFVPRERINEESGKRTAAEKRAEEAERRAELNEQRLRIAMGLEVVKPEDKEANEVREALLKTYPKLALLEKLDEEQLERVLGAADSAEQATRAQWARHNTGMLDNLTEEAADILGVEKLSEAQTKRLHRAFREEAREQAGARQRAAQTQDSTYDFQNDWVSRYERGDKKILTEFAKSFVDEWGIPVRRAANASALNRQSRPVPNGGRVRTPLTQGPPKIDYNDDKAFRDAMIAARSGGGDV
jgi:hypothetical protein